MPNKNPTLSIHEAAGILKVATKTLRRWEALGKLIPQRTPGGHRRYSLEQIELFQKGKATSDKTAFDQSFQPAVVSYPPESFNPPSLYTDLHLNQRKILAGVYTAFMLTLGFFAFKHLALPIIGEPFGQIIELTKTSSNASVRQIGSVLSYFDSESSALSVEPETKVLAAEDINLENPIFNINVKSVFNDDVGFNKSAEVTEDVAINGGDLTSTAATFNLVNTNTTTLNIGGAATALDLGAASGTTTVNNNLAVVGNIDVNGTSNDIAGTLNLSGNTLNSSGNLTITPSSKVIIAGNLAPEATGTRTLGESSFYWKSLYVNNIYTPDSGTVGYWKKTSGVISPVVDTDSLTIGGNTTLNGNTTLGNATTDTITFTGRLANGSSIFPNTDLGSDLGSATLRYNNIWAANINSNSSATFSGQTIFTYAPLNTTYTESSVMINPTAPVANGYLLGFGVAGYQRAGVDVEGDIRLGYNNQISLPASDNPLEIYNHGSTKVAFVDTSGEAYFAGKVGIGTSTFSSSFEIAETDTSTSGTHYMAQETYTLNPAASSTGTYFAHSISGTASSSNISTFVGLSASISGSGGIIDVARALDVGISAESSNINTGYGINITGQGGPMGVLDKMYAVYIADLSTATTRYGIYQTGTTDNNYFAGKIGIGTTLPGTELGIVGGVGIGTTDSFANAAIAANNLAVQGSVGIGTTSPYSSVSTLGVVGGIAIGTTATYANKQTPTGGLIVEGSVGIGTTSPSAALEVASSTSGSNPLALFKKNVDSSKVGIGTDGVMSGSASDALFFPQNAGANVGGMAFYSTSGPTKTFRMGITNTGNVGIGTVAPATKLGVVGGVGIGTTDSFANAAIAANNLAVQGSVGIGFTAPSYPLDVNGYIRGTGLITPYQQTVTVAKAGGDYTSIQSAINSIADESSSKRYLVLIYPGEYNETVITTDYIDLRGVDRDSVRIYSSSTDINVPIVKLDSNVIISDLSIENTAAVASAAQGINTSGVTTATNSKISNVKVKGNWDAIYITNSGDDVTIENSYIDGGFDGIGLDDGALVRAYNNTIKYTATYTTNSRAFIAAGSNTKLYAIGNTIEVTKGASTAGAIHGFSIITGAKAYLSANHIKLTHSTAAEDVVGVYTYASPSTAYVTANTFELSAVGTTYDLYADAAGSITLYNQAYDSLYKDATSTVSTLNTRFNNLFLAGNLGVGTTNPGTDLSVAGGVGIGTTNSFASAAIADNNLAVQGLVGIGISNPASKLQVQTATSALTGKAALVVDQYESQELLTASASGVTTFAVDSSGNIYGNLSAGIGTTTVCYASATLNGATLEKLGACTVGGDLAEYYPVDPDNIPLPGEVVTIDNPISGALRPTFSVKKANIVADPKMVGVVSTQAHQIMGEDILEWAEAAAQIALVGRVPVKIASTSQPINPGDFLTSSTESGKAQKAENDGYTLGKALEAWNCTDPAKTALCRETILVYLNQSVDITKTLANQTATPSASANLTDRITNLEAELELLKSQLLLSSSTASTSASLEKISTTSLMVLNDATLADTVINGKLTLGSLTLDNLDSSINSVSALKLQPMAFAPVSIMNNKVEIDTAGNLKLNEGVILGNASIRGQETLLTGQTALEINKTWETAPVSISVASSYETTVWIENLTQNGFTLKVKNPPTNDAKIYWTAIW